MSELYGGDVGIWTVQVLGFVNRGDVDQHDGDLVLDWVDSAADAAFEAFSVDVHEYWFLANRADQYVE